MEMYDVLIVGAGPAGMAAAVRASQSGVRVGVVDDNPDLGGQIWRNEKLKPKSDESKIWFERIRSAEFDFIAGTRIVGQASENSLLGERDGEPIELGYHHLILATGARELFLPFPGWTLPNVMGAGGLQALVKSGLPIEGKTVVVAGSGPLLVAVAAFLKSRGAHVALIAEQAPLWRLGSFGLAVARDAVKRRQALALRAETKGIPYRTGTWPVEALGHEHLESIRLTNGRSTWQVVCDYLACGFGLVPNSELAGFLGSGIQTCDDSDPHPTKPVQARVVSVGESIGIGGLACALVEGEIAGLLASGQVDKARELIPKRTKDREFATVLAHSFALRDELKKLATPDTIVCRCEDVKYSALVNYSNFTSAKLQTRCGMGPCQAKVCGAATTFLFGWTDVSLRPPLGPVSLATLAKVQQPHPKVG